jgi:hypothetical protein
LVYLEFGSNRLLNEENCGREYFINWKYLKAGFYEEFLEFLIKKNRMILQEEI